jgi:outer membrane protein assembly factor BamB
MRLQQSLLVALVVCPTLAFADWPRFRGPNGSGVAPSAGTPAAFTPGDFNWSIDLPGKGHSSPVIVGKRVFVTCGDVESARRSIVCVDVDTGKELWHRDYDSHTFRQHNDNSYATASPAADAQRVYFTFTAPESYKVYCLDHAGKDVWAYDMGPWVSQHGAGPSPIVFEDLLIVPNDQDGPTACLAALDVKTGQPRWKIPRNPGNASKSTPCVYQPKGGPAQIIVTNTGNGMTGIDPHAGKPLWTTSGSPNKWRAVSSPIAADGFVMATWGEGARNRGGFVAIPAGPEGGSISVPFKMPTGIAYPYVPSPVVSPDGKLMFLWSDAGIATCVRVGSWETVWQEKVFKGETPKERVGQEFYSSPIIAGDKLYNITKTGEVICLRAGERFEILGRSPLHDLCYATPAVDGNRLIIRTATKLVSVGGK